MKSVVKEAAKKLFLLVDSQLTGGWVRGCPKEKKTFLNVLFLFLIVFFYH